MKNLISLKDYKDRYNVHLEEITHLQKLLVIEEQKLFALVETKKQVLIDSKINRHSQTRVAHFQ